MGPVARICASICAARERLATSPRRAESDEADTGDEDRQAQQNAHGEPAAIEVAELGIGQAEKFNEDAAERVADAENAGGEPGALQRLKAVGRDADDDPEQDTFE